MSMRYNPATGMFFLAPGTPGPLLVEAEAAGFDYSAPDQVWYTDQPHAALPFWDVMDAPAQRQTEVLKSHYDASYAQVWTGSRWRMPPNVELMPYQSCGVDYALKRGGRALLGDQPGLGKTCQAIVTANELGARRVIVVCPASVRRQWAAEIRTWSTQRGCQPVIHIVENSKLGINPAAGWVIVSYDLARTPVIWCQLMAYKPELVVGDELHYGKTSSASRTRAMFGGGEGLFSKGGFASAAPYLLGATGTPLPNRPREAFVAARNIEWSSIDFMSEAAFEKRYNPSETVATSRGYRTLEAIGRLAELNARLRCSFMVRRDKTKVLDQLPPVTYQVVEVDETAAIKKAISHEKMLNIDPTTLKAVGQFDGAISTVRREMGEAMAPQVVSHVEALMDGGLDKLVLFYWHRSVGDYLETKLAKYGILKMDGAISANNKEILKLTFMRDPARRILAGNLQTMGTGVDGLQKVCSWAVFAEADWRPGENQQCVDRLWRIGQTGKGVMAQFMVAPGSISAYIIKTVVKKAHVVDAALDRSYIQPLA